MAKSQIQKFREAARDLGTYDNEKRFKERLSEVARQRPALRLKKVAKR
jgi:hypothetical protein